jgi:hypothetical protein
MKERLKLVDGQLSIESKPGHGTTIQARVPSLMSFAVTPLRRAIFASPHNSLRCSFEVLSRNGCLNRCRKLEASTYQQGSESNTGRARCQDNQFR